MKKKEIPFKDDLVPFEHLSQFKDGSYVVRFEPKHFVEAEVGHHNPDWKGVVREGKLLWDELRRYGMPIPETLILLGKDEAGVEGAYVLTKKVQRRIDITDMEKLKELDSSQKEEISLEIDNTLSLATRYLREKLQTKEKFIWDLYRLEQYEFGVVDQEDKPKLYLVDTDVHVFRDDFEVFGIYFIRLKKILDNFSSAGYSLPKFSQELELLRGMPSVSL